MIKFFSKIRYDLMEKNKTGRYFKYAIGEIVLVVIGILIALQINNWNEDRKSANLEEAILIDLKQDLIVTEKLMENNLNQNKLNLNNLESIIYNIDNEISYSKQMDTLFSSLNSWSSPYPIMTAYEIFKNTGVETITDKLIKEKTITLYESTFTFLNDDYDRAEWAFFETVTNPFISKNFAYDILYEREVLTPNRYEELVKNPEFKNIITFVQNLRKSGLKVYSNAIDEIQELIELIDKELENRTNK